MSRHLTDERLMDVLEQTADADARRHAADCAACRSRLDAAREGLLLAQADQLPEPSPLYWDAFRRQVGRGLGEARRGPSWRWLLWPALAASGVVGLSLVTTKPASAPGPAVTATLPAWSPLPAAEDDESLPVLEAFVSDGEDLAALAGCGGLAGCLADLSDEEAAALAESLDSVLQGGAAL